MNVSKKTNTNCSLCNKITGVKLINGKYICEDCIKNLSLSQASLEALEEWQQSITYRDGYDDVIDRTINALLEEILLICDNIEEQKKMLLKKIEYEIKVRLEYYNMDDLFAAFLTVRETIRRLLLILKKDIDWVMIGDVSSINYLMQITQKLKDFENNPMGNLENNCSNFANAICYARRYNMIIQNMELTRKKEVSLRDICFEAVQTDNTENYFDDYLKNGVNEKPEDYQIKNENLKKS